MMMIYHFRDVSVTTALLVAALMNLIFFTGLLQVTVANDESTPKSASSDGNKQLGNGKLASLGGMNMAHFANLGSSDLECAVPQFSDSCSKKAKEIANVTTKDDTYLEAFGAIFSVIAKATKSDEKVKKACDGFKNLLTCSASKKCQNCAYLFSFISDVTLTILNYKDFKICNYSEVKPICTAKQWKAIHKKSYPGECVPDADKLKCVQKADPNATDWETGLYSVFGNFTILISKKSCLDMLELAKCEVTSGCHKCKDDEETQLEAVFYSWLSSNEKCVNISGFDKNEVTSIDCNKVPTPKPTVTPTPTSSSKTVIIIVVVVVIALLIIGGIVVYCCFFAGDSGKKKTGGKQGQKVTGKGGAVSGSKMGSDGKSSSVRGGSKSQVGSKLAADSKVGAGKSVA